MPELSWLGDKDAKRTARRVPYRLLQPISTVGDAASGNLLIQGDKLSDFFIGAHAAVLGCPILTRDAARYRGYFPTVQLITP